SILLLSEDTAGTAHETLAALARHMLRLIDPAIGTHHIRFEPPDSPAVKRAIRANLWESTEPRDQNDRRALIAYIATKLCEGPRSFVLFHFDGDLPWSSRDRDRRAEKFRRLIEGDVFQLVEHRRRQLSEEQRRHGEPSIAQLFRIIPHYSIEA